MQIVQSSSTQLIIRDRPWIIAGFLWLAGVLAIRAAITGEIETDSAQLWTDQLLVSVLGIGVCTIAWFGFPFQTIWFDRKKGLLTHRRLRLLQNLTQEIPLASIQRARAEKYWGESTWMERLTLDLADRNYPLEWGYSGVSREPLAQAVNAWLRDVGGD